MGRLPDNALLGAADEALASLAVFARLLGMLADPGKIHRDRGQGDKSKDFYRLLRIARKLRIFVHLKANCKAVCPYCESGAIRLRAVELSV